MVMMSSKSLSVDLMQLPFVKHFWPRGLIFALPGENETRRL
jgi:hypothetical protein